MATFEEDVKKIQIKFKLLDLAVQENERIISGYKVNELVKQQKLFEKCSDEIKDLKVAAEEFMLEDDKSLREVHIILGASNFDKIKMEKSPQVGKVSEIFAELTKMGWVMMSPGRESDIVSALYTQTCVSDYEELCSNDILGLEESHYNPDEFVLEKFKKQLKRSKEGWNETVHLEGK